MKQILSMKLNYMVGLNTGPRLSLYDLDDLFSVLVRYCGGQCYSLSIFFGSVHCNLPIDIIPNRLHRRLKSLYPNPKDRRYGGDSWRKPNISHITENHHTL
jgi:hypothetical protein